MSVNIDWNNLGFDYMQLPYRYVAHWKDGAWDEGKLSTNPNLTMNEGSRFCIMVKALLKV